MHGPNLRINCFRFVCVCTIHYVSLSFKLKHHIDISMIAELKPCIAMCVWGGVFVFACIRVFECVCACGVRVWCVRVHACMLANVEKDRPCAVPSSW